MFRSNTSRVLAMDSSGCLTWDGAGLLPSQDVPREEQQEFVILGIFFLSDSMRKEPLQPSSWKSQAELIRVYAETAAFEESPDTEDRDRSVPEELENIVTSLAEYAREYSEQDYAAGTRARLDFEQHVTAAQATLGTTSPDNVEKVIGELTGALRHYRGELQRLEAIRERRKLFWAAFWDVWVAVDIIARDITVLQFDGMIGRMYELLSTALRSSVARDQLYARSMMGKFVEGACPRRRTHSHNFSFQYADNKEVADNIRLSLEALADFLAAGEEGFECARMHTDVLTRCLAAFPPHSTPYEHETSINKSLYKIFCRLEDLVVLYGDPGPLERARILLECRKKEVKEILDTGSLESTIEANRRLSEALEQFGKATDLETQVRERRPVFWELFWDLWRVVDKLVQDIPSYYFDDTVAPLYKAVSGSLRSSHSIEALIAGSLKSRTT